AASRYYAYITLAANETSGLFDKKVPRFCGVLKGSSEISINDSLVKKSQQQFATILALYKSASRLLPSGKMLQKNIDSMRTVATRKKLSLEKINATSELVDKLVAIILKYAYDDGFVKLSGMRRFTPATGDE